MGLAATCDAAELAVAEAEEPEAEVALAEPEPVATAEPEAAPVAEAVAEPAAGEPKVVTPDGMGPTGAEAEAPTPTK